MLPTCASHVMTGPCWTLSKLMFRASRRARMSCSPAIPITAPRRSGAARTVLIDLKIGNTVQWHPSRRIPRPIAPARLRFVRAALCAVPSLVYPLLLIDLLLSVLKELLATLC